MNAIEVDDMSLTVKSQDEGMDLNNGAIPEQSKDVIYERAYISALPVYQVITSDERCMACLLECI